MQIVLIAAVVLAAVLAGAAIPVLIQLRSTLQSAQRVLDQVGPQLKRTLEDVSETTQRVNAMAAEIEEKGRKAGPIVDAALDMGSHITRLGGTLRTAAAIGSAVGPAVSAAIKAFVTKPNGSESPDKEDTE